MGKSVKKNYIYNLIYQILTIILPLATTPYLSRVLQADGIGTVSYATSIVSYFVLFANVGIATYGQRQISYVQDSIEDRSRVFWETQVLKLITTSISLAVYIPFAIFVVNSDLTWMYLILSVQIFSVCLDSAWFFQGMEEFGKIVGRNIIFRVISIVFIFVLVRRKEDLIYYVLGVVGIEVLSAVSIWSYLPKYVKKVPFKTLKPFRDFKTVMALFIPTVAIQIYTVLDKTMIGIITNDAYQNGYYEQAIKITQIALTVIGSLGTVMIPRIGYYHQKGEDKTVREWMYRSYRFVWLLSIPMCIGLFFVTGNFVPWFFGDGYDGVVPLLQILSLLLLAIGINGVTGKQYLIPTKRENTFTLTVVIGAVINFVFNLFLIYFFQAIGAAIASVLAETVIAVCQLIIVRKELSICKILRSSVKYWIAGIVMGVLLFFENRYFDPSIINTIIMITSGAIIYFVVLFALKDQFLISNVKSISGKFINKKKGKED
jgi:O-antigen/teichoic acid export membrane protein